MFCLKYILFRDTVWTPVNICLVYNLFFSHLLFLCCFRQVSPKGHLSFLPCVRVSILHRAQGTEPKAETCYKQAFCHQCFEGVSHCAAQTDFDVVRACCHKCSHAHPPCCEVRHCFLAVNHHFWLSQFFVSLFCK